MATSLDAAATQRMNVQEMRNAHVHHQIINIVQDEKPVWRRFIDGFAWGAGASTASLIVACTAYKIALIANGTIKGGSMGAQAGTAFGPGGIVVGTTLGAAAGAVVGAAGVLV